MAKFLDPVSRKAQILEAAVNRSRVEPYFKMTRDELAAYAGISAGAVNKYFGTIESLRQEVIREAIRLEIPEILVHAVGRGEPLAKNLSPMLKQKVISAML